MALSAIRSRMLANPAVNSPVAATVPVLLIRLNSAPACGENAKFPGQPTEPLIHIYMMDEALDFSDMYLNPEECLEDESAELINNVLFSWDKTPESWQDQYWSFSVKLTSVNSLQDLREKIIAPAVELITSEYQDDVAVKLSDIEGIVRFK